MSEPGKDFLQLGQKASTVGIVRMVWNPKMDIVAFTSTSNEVCLYRLSWQKVWSLPCEGPGAVFAWRPDGKGRPRGTRGFVSLSMFSPELLILGDHDLVSSQLFCLVLAVGYNNGIYQLLDVEDHRELHRDTMEGAITSLHWEEV